MDQTEASFGNRRNYTAEHKASTAADAKAALRDDIARLCDGLSARLPQYWRWVGPTQYKAYRDGLLALGLRAQDRSLDVAALERLCGELRGLERLY